MRRFIVLAAVLVVIGSTGRAEAKWPHRAPPMFAGKASWAGVPGMGGPLPRTHTPPGMSPVIGSVSRTGHFAHPITGRTRYTGTAYDPVLGRFTQYRFKQ